MDEKINCKCDKSECIISDYNGFDTQWKLSIITTKIIEGVRKVSGVFRIQSKEHNEGNCEVYDKLKK